MQSIKSCFLLFLLAIVLTSCATAPVLKWEKVEPTLQIKTYPEAQQQWIKGLGETLVSKTILNVGEGIEILEEIVWELSNIKYTIPSQKIKKNIVYENGNFGFGPLKFNVEGNNTCPMVSFYWNLGEPYIWVCVWGRQLPVDSSLIKQGVEIEWENPLNFEQQLIYNGRVGDNLKFVYREFNKNMARSAFSQEVQYDLSESNIIGFKEVRIEVIEATNSNITYKVLKHFY